jgi:hypothetical protein
LISCIFFSSGFLCFQQLACIIFIKEDFQGKERKGKKKGKEETRKKEKGERERKEGREVGRRRERGKEEERRRGAARTGWRAWGGLEPLGPRRPERASG